MAPRTRLADIDTPKDADAGPDEAPDEVDETPEEAPDEAPDEAVEPPRRRRRVVRIALIGSLATAILAGAGAAGVMVYLRSVESDIERVEAFEAVPPQSRPERVTTQALNVLVLGSDSRDPENKADSRTDTIILAHVAQDRSSAQLVSIPRDTWVYVPKSKDGKHGNTNAKINAAFAWGGIPLMVQTVESFTGVRIDHVAVVDFAGFKEIVDALGGVEIDVEESFTSTHSLNPDSRRAFRKGPQIMDGAAALDYARERFAFRDGDFARIRHQQQVIRAILDKASAGGLLTNPSRLNAFLRATADAVAVDETLDVFGTAMGLRHLRSENLAFYTSPSTGTDDIGTESVVLPDLAKARILYDAIRRDAVAEIATAGQ